MSHNRVTFEDHTKRKHKDVSHMRLMIWISLSLALSYPFSLVFCHYHSDSFSLAVFHPFLFLPLTKSVKLPHSIAVASPSFMLSLSRPLLPLSHILSLAFVSCMSLHSCAPG